MLIKTPYKDFDPDNRITGDLYYDSNGGLYLFGYNSKYYLSTTLGVTLKVDDSTYITQYFSINGYNYWSGSGLYLFYSDDYGYVITGQLGYGTEESDQWWKSDGGLVGDYFEQLPEDSEETPTIITVSINHIVGWQGNSLLGVYYLIDENGEIDEESENVKYVGLRKFVDDQDTPQYYTQSPVKGEEYWSYGNIYHEGLQQNISNFFGGVILCPQQRWC